MCRWGCPTVDTTYKCKWCGTRFCRACFRGDFSGCMWEVNRCRVCNQLKCVGERVEYIEKPKQPAVKKGNSSSIKSRSKSGKSTKSTKASRKSGRPAKSAKKKKTKKKK